MGLIKGLADRTRLAGRVELAERTEMAQRTKLSGRTDLVGARYAVSSLTGATNAAESLPSTKGSRGDQYGVLSVPCSVRVPCHLPGQKQVLGVPLGPQDPFEQTQALGVSSRTQDPLGLTQILGVPSGQKDSLGCSSTTLPRAVTNKRNNDIMR